MALKGIIFDLDGTLVYTLAAYRHEVVSKTIKELEGNVPEAKIIDKFWFEMQREKIIKEQFNLESLLFWETFRRHDLADKRKKFTRAFNDTSFVKELRNNNIKTAIVSGAQPNIAEMEVGLIGRKNFDAVLLANQWENRRPKPHPESLEHCLKMLELKKSEAVFVGNSDEDIIAAQNAGILDVFIERKEHFFPEIKPSLVISSLLELKKFLE